MGTIIRNNYPKQLSDGCDCLMIRDCPLCQVYDINDNDCVGCPIFEDTGQRNCEDTPYDDWWQYAYDNIMGYGHATSETNNTIDAKYIELATVELNFLKRIQSELIKEAKYEIIPRT